MRFHRARLAVMSEQWNNFEAQFLRAMPEARFMAFACHNSDVAEYWEWSATGMFPVNTTNDAYKLGINAMIYALLH
jgi:hypothetical protein